MQPLSQDEIQKINLDENANLIDRFLDSPGFAKRVIHNYLEDWRFQTNLDNNSDTRFFFGGNNDYTFSPSMKRNSIYELNNYLNSTAYQNSSALKYLLEQDNVSWNTLMSSRNFAMLPRLSEDINNLFNEALSLILKEQRFTLYDINSPDTIRKVNQSLKEAANILETQLNEILQERGISKQEAIAHLTGAKRLPPTLETQSKLNLLFNSVQPYLTATNASDLKLVFENEPLSAILLVQDLILPKAKDDFSITFLTESLRISLENEEKTRWPIVTSYMFSSPTYALKLIELMKSDRTINPHNTMSDLLNLISSYPDDSGLQGPLGSFMATQRFNQTEFSMSAAFFRAYLCDDMKLSSTGQSDTTRAALARLRLNIPGDNSNLSQNIRPEGHGAKDCQTCHRKLDPVKSFITNPGMPGKLVFDDQYGVEQKIEVKVGQTLIQAIMENRSYHSCQAKKFWNWIIGTDVQFAGNKAEELTNKYISSNGNIKELVKYLIQRPEFTDSKFITDPLTFDSVKPILSRCNTCHDSSFAIVAKFDSVPFQLYAIEKNEHFQWSKELMKATKAHRYGESSTMPPAASGWKLEREELELLTRWMHEGARNQQGKQTLTEHEVKEILNNIDNEMSSVIQNPTAKATMYSTWLRYLRGYEIVSSMQAVFGEPMATCISSNQVALGFHDPMMGRPSSSNIPKSLLDLITRCFSNNEYGYHTGPTELISETLDQLQRLKWPKVTATNGTWNIYGKVSWVTLAEEHQELILSELIKKIIMKDKGTEAHSKFMGLVKIAIEENTQLNSVVEVINEAALTVVLSQEFLTY